MNNFSFSSTLLLAQAAEDKPFRPKVPESDSLWQPVAASNFAQDVDWLYAVVLGVSAVVVVGVVLAMTAFALKYRAKSRDDSAVAESDVSHNTPLEITWSVLPMIFFVAIFAWGFKGFVDMRSTPKDALEIKATATKWNWDFTYPNGESNNRLHVPLGRDVRILIQSMDVIHSLYIPAFRVKMDAVPGRYTELWFRPTKDGKYPIFCTEYCGQKHSEMLSEVTVEPQSEYEKFLESIEPVGTPEEIGLAVYQNKGCSTCHSTDGTPKVGPTWKGIFGQDRKFADGSSGKVDENYIRESILEPNAKIVDGFTPAMPTYQGQLDDKKIDGVIAYIKTLK